MGGSRTASPFVGYWRITEMELWDAEYLDLVVPAFIEFDREHMGQFQFGTVRGWLDCRFGERDGVPAVEFSWEGETDTDPGCGRGWGVLRNDRLEGRLYIHRGDDSSFVASRASRPASVDRRKSRVGARHLTSRCSGRRRGGGGAARLTTQSLTALPAPPDSPASPAARR